MEVIEYCKDVVVSEEAWRPQSVIHSDPNRNGTYIGYLPHGALTRNVRIETEEDARWAILMPGGGDCPPPAHGTTGSVLRSGTGSGIIEDRLVLYSLGTVTEYRIVCTKPFTLHYDMCAYDATSLLPEGRQECWIPYEASIGGSVYKDILFGVVLDTHGKQYVYASGWRSSVPH
jgi:hypothetical protein